MAATHHHTVRVHGLSSQVGLASNGLQIAVPLQKINIGVWHFQELSAKPLELTGHRKPVLSLCFNQRPMPTLLCSSAQDYVIVWNLEKAQAATDAGHPVRGTIIGTCLGYIQHSSFSCDDSQIAVCVEKQVLILDPKTERTISCLEGHDANVTCAEFCPHYSATLVTAGEDRTFKVWNLEDESLVYRSTIISSSPFISLTMNPTSESFALGTADGQVRVYDLTDGNGFRCLQHLNVEKLVNKLHAASKREEDVCKSSGPSTISSRPSWQRSPNVSAQPEDDEEDENSAEVGCSVVSMLYTLPAGRSRAPTPAKLSFLTHDPSIVSDLLGRPPMLIIATTGALLQVNSQTLEPCSFVNLQEPVPSCSLLEDSSHVVPLIQCARLTQSPLTDEVWCLCSGLFVSEVAVLSISEPTQQATDDLRLQLTTSKFTQLTAAESPTDLSHEVAGVAEADATSQVTVLSSAPLLPNSPLKAELILKEKDKKSKKGASKTAAGSGDKALVFQEKIKSSGYTAAPRQGMFNPQTNKKNSTPQKNGKTTSQFKMAAKEYPVTCDPPTKVKVKLDIAERPTATNTINFSGDGQMLACSLVNTSTQVFKMPLTGKGYTFTGHNGPVNSASWSHDNRYIVTSSEDKTAALWSLGLSDPIMVISHAVDNFGSDKEGGLKISKENPAFSKPVRFAQFYYMDRFILLTHGNAFSLYKYHVDTSKSDIKRYLSNNRYKLVQSFQMSQAQHITAFSAINSFYSYLALCAGTDKSLEVFDLNVGQSVRSIPDVHTRPPHVIHQNKGSVFVSHPSSAYDLFVTAAASDCIKLWDLRSNRCVRRYEGHTNRVHPCGAAISPCSRFIATGSEDRCAYIFDIRSGTYLHKLTGHTDTVADVEFHPLHPELVTSSVDGKLRLFSAS